MTTKHKTLLTIDSANIATSLTTAFNPSTWLNDPQQVNRIKNTASGWILKKYLDTYSAESCKNGRNFQLTTDDNGDINQTLTAYEDKINLWQHLQKALYYMMLDGYSLLLILTKTKAGKTTEEQLKEPLQAEEFQKLQLIKKSQFSFVQDDIEHNIGADNYNQHTFYYLNLAKGNKMKIHASRFLVFKTGDTLEESEPMVTNLLNILNELETLRTERTIASYKSNTEIFKIQGLNNVQDQIQTQADKEELVRGLQNRRDYKNNIIILDAEDSYQKVDKNLDDFTKSMDALKVELAGATGIPVTKLYGTSSAGFSNGEEDIVSYYGNIKAFQEAYIREPLVSFDNYLFKLLFNTDKPTELTFDFNSLYDSDKTQETNNKKTMGDLLLNINNAGVIGTATTLSELNNLNILQTISEEDIKRAEELDTAETLSDEREEVY